jgi:hypothetical protein
LEAIFLLHGNGLVDLDSFPFFVYKIPTPIFGQHDLAKNRGFYLEKILLTSADSLSIFHKSIHAGNNDILNG